MKTKKGLYLSHSQINTFVECPMKWYIERIERLRPVFIGSALVFGGAFDAAVEHLLLKKEGDIQEVFLENLNSFEVNRKSKKLPEDLLAIKFFASNIDQKLLRDIDLSEDFERLGVEIPEYNHKKKSDQEMFIAEFLDYCKGGTELDETEQLLFNTLAYRTILEAGPLMIDAVKEWIDENVKEVHEVQKKIEIDDGHGNKFVGYLDFIVTLKDGRELLIDLKTSSNPKLYYPEESASESSQLGIYAQEVDIFDVAYLVVDKSIRVKEPRVRISFIEGEITDEHLDKVFGDIETCVQLIQEKLDLGKGAFEKNKDACGSFGGCPYRDYCWKGDKNKLEKV